MLKKLPAVQVPADAPFKDDVLKREGCAANLTRVIESSDAPLVLTVEAPWGSGKTTFIRMWKALLESKGHTCLYFNAWESDFVDDPLVPFISEMKKVLETEQSIF